MESGDGGVAVQHNSGAGAVYLSKCVFQAGSRGEAVVPGKGKKWSVVEVVLPMGWGCVALRTHRAS